MGDQPDVKPTFGHGVSDVVFGSGGRIASTVYGTIVVTATLTAAYASQSNPWKLAVIVATTAVVLWVAHLYSHALAESIAQGHRVTRRDLIGIAQREIGILLAAAAPTLALVLGALGVLEETSAIWLALAIGLVTLAVEGVRYARIERLGRTGTLIAVSGNLVLGLIVVVLKVAIAH